MTTVPAPRPPLRTQMRLMRQLLADPQPVLDEVRTDHGPVVVMGGGPARMAIVGGPAEVHEILSMPTERFRWNHKFNVLAFVVGQSSLIASDGEDHRRRRASVMTAFSRRRLQQWIPMIVDRTDAAVDELDATADDGVCDLFPVGRNLVLSIVVRAFFGERLAPRAREIGDLFQAPQDYLESPAYRQIPHPLPRTRRAQVRNDRRTLDAIIDAEIAHHRAHPSDDPDDVLETLVTNTELTEAEIRDQVVTLIGAGYDTTAASLGWMLWRCAHDPDVWAALRAEADAVFGPLDAPTRPPDAATLAELTLADRVMHESLRLHPAGVISPRETTEDIVVGGFEIPSGTLVLWSPHLAGRDPETWTDPLRFDPDRFLDPTDEQRALQDAAWVPFGGGRRNCIGFALAQMELTLIIARLAQHLDLEPTRPDLPPAVGMVVNRPAGGVPMRVSRRST